MCSIVRSVLIWLMVLAMPVQGMAASTVVFCGPLHERMMLPPAAADHDESAVPEHEHLWRMQAHAATVLPDDSAAAADAAGMPAMNRFTHPGTFSCSACASCCSMLAIPESFASVGEPDLVNTTPAALAVGVQSFVTEGPERPPRSALA